MGPVWCGPTVDDRASTGTLGQYATSHKGICTGDTARFVREFWQVPRGADGWSRLRTSVTTTTLYGGCENALFWEDGQGQFVNFVDERLGGNTGAWIRGGHAWGRRGVAIARMSGLPSTLYLVFCLRSSDPIEVAA